MHWPSQSQYCHLFIHLHTSPRQGTCLQNPGSSFTRWPSTWHKNIDELWSMPPHINMVFVSSGTIGSPSTSASPQDPRFANGLQENATVEPRLEIFRHFIKTTADAVKFLGSVGILCRRIFYINRPTFQ